MKRSLVILSLIIQSISSNLFGQGNLIYTLYTPLGRAIECKLYIEFTQSEILQKNEYNH